jgi:hypothetical protein
MRTPALALALAACPGPPAPAVCADVCELLMADCGYAAFPGVGSCQQGCGYEVAEGAELPALHSCLLEAGCDTPTVLACARAYGGAP